MPAPLVAPGRGIQMLRPLQRRLSRLRRDLSGASAEAFRRYLLGALDATLDGAILVRGLAEGSVATMDANGLMATIEHRGDAERAKLVAELRSALVTPIDREDLFRLSRAIDDILDNLRDFVRQWTLFDVHEAKAVALVADRVVDAIVELRLAVAVLVQDPRAIGDRSLAAKKSTNAIRRVFDQQVAALLVGSVTTTMLRERELLRRLDVVGLRLGEAADALAEAAVKRAEG